ncbi:hypothetical protein CORC01_04595 [Colletotrichum orchidophilum]|uniref:Uncharacterized protein n=1 Tax=Colletotrichum orchidophilum TaxID=1209926 RepID=A0A1G4BFU2_9PEZI|nr:uncharacterized protein CORC01_04595 [Colletotrichum orchidophilum]OHF00187.1 hypothetical protein CORC01_04595 [Colletotrichum orchidophilum]
MSSPAKTTAEEQSRAPAYPTSYAPANTGARGNMPAPGLPVPMPNLSGTANGPVGNLLRGPVDENGKLTKAALMVGIKLDLEAEVHLTARVRAYGKDEILVTMKGRIVTVIEVAFVHELTYKIQAVKIMEDLETS